MSDLEREQIRRLVGELDRAVPRDGAHVRLEQYGGGPDESRIVANEIGFMRLGIELLQAGVASVEATPTPVDVDLTYLVDSDSVIGFHEIIRDDDLPVVSRPVRSGIDIVAIVGTTGCLAVVVLAIIGAIAVIRWVNGAIG